VSLAFFFSVVPCLKILDPKQGWYFSSNNNSILVKFHTERVEIKNLRLYFDTNKIYFLQNFQGIGSCAPRPDKMSASLNISHSQFINRKKRVYETSDGGSQK
jgi:hypothetical protein